MRIQVELDIYVGIYPRDLVIPDWAIWRAAQLRRQGEIAWVRIYCPKDAPIDCVVVKQDGTEERAKKPGTPPKADSNETERRNRAKPG